MKLIGDIVLQQLLEALRSQLKRAACIEVLPSFHSVGNWELKQSDIDATFFYSIGFLQVQDSYYRRSGLCM